MKKKWLLIGIIIIFSFGGIIYILNIKVTTRQGINFQWQSIEIPLYLKVLDFFDRHYNYKWTVKRIIDKSKTDEERVMKIFKWTYENIKKAPEGYPVIDDHVWHIIIRGYGVIDQSSDVFTTLCSYADIEAFYTIVHSENNDSRMLLSFVKIDELWNVFDTYNGVYFQKKEGKLANIEDINKGNWVEKSIDNKRQNINYAVFFNRVTIPNINELRRANIQSPINRLRYEVRRWLEKLNKLNWD